MQNDPKWCKSSCHEVVLEFFTTNHSIQPLEPNLMFRCVSNYLGAFGRVWLRYNTQCKTGQPGAKVRATKSRWNFLQRTQPDPPHWTLNSCFGVFHTIWMHLGPFGCLTKLSAKRAEVVEKFVPRSHVTIFRNEHTELTPRDLNSCFGAFCTIWVHLVLFGCLTKLGPKRAKVV